MLSPDQERRFAALGPWHTRWELGGRSYGGTWAEDGARVRQFTARFGATAPARLGRVLELSCLEGRHTVELAQIANTVVALEGRPGHVERARFVTALLGAGDVAFHVADLETANLSEYGRFDAVFCVGLLYHLRSPWSLLQRCAGVSDRLFLWSHYCPDDRASAEAGGYAGRWQDEDIGSATSALAPRSFWLTRASLLAALRRAGFSRIEVLAEEPLHPNDPWITLACETAPAAAWLDRFRAVAQGFAALGALCATSPEEMAVLAAGIEELAAAGTPGNVLECGAWTGFSACCLSLVCARLGRRLFVADSFQGLPDPVEPPGNPGDEVYHPGQYSASRETFLANLARLGAPEVVTVIPGWYADSLGGFREPLRCIWLDVDLGRSVRDALAGALPCLHPKGLIYSHETEPGYFEGADLGPRANAVWQALRRALRGAGRRDRARFVMGCLGEVRHDP